MRSLQVAAALLLAGCGTRGTPSEVSYSADIQPILNDHCTICHAEGVRQGGIALDSYERVMSSRYFSRPAPLVIPGKPQESRLYLTVHSTRPGIRMPPPGTGIEALDEQEVEFVRVWIAEGAKNN